MVTLERQMAHYPDEKITKSYTAYLNNLIRPNVEEYNAPVAFNLASSGLELQLMMGIRQTLLATVLLLGSAVAMAQPDRSDSTASSRKTDAQMGPQTTSHQQVERASFATNRFEQRDDTIQPTSAEHHSGRLSPDERRELRRQINEVGQDIYRPHR
jgi:hypothetical protein